MWELNSARDKVFFSPRTLHLFEGKMQQGNAKEEKKERVKEGDFLLVQWIRIRLSRQETQV